MKLQAEVTGGGEGAEFALKRLTPVLVLMYLEKEGGVKSQIPSSVRGSRTLGEIIGFFTLSQLNL